MNIDVPALTITSIVTNGTVNGISATKINPIIIGTHNLDTSKFNSKIEIWADNASGNSDNMLVKASEKYPQYRKSSLLGYTSLLDSSGNWSCRVSATKIGNYYNLQARALYTKWVVPPERRKRAGPFLPTLPVFSTPADINYRFTYFGEISGPPTISYVVKHTTYDSRISPIMFQAKTFAEQQLEILWTMTNANTLICELNNPNETIIIVNSEKGFPPLVSGYNNRPYTPGQRSIIIKPNNNSTGVPWEVWTAPSKGKPLVQTQRNRNLYVVTRPIILRAIGPLGTIEKTILYKSIINKYPMSW